MTPSRYLTWAAAAFAAAVVLLTLPSCSKEEAPAAAIPPAPVAETAELPPVLTAENVDLPPDTERAVSRAILPGRMYDIDDNGVAYCVVLTEEEPHGAVVAVTVQDGEVKWRFSLSDLPTPEGRVARPAGVVVACSNQRAHLKTIGGMYGALDAASGTLEYSKDVLPLGHVTGLAADDRFGYLLLGGGLRALDGATGEESWAFFTSATLVDTAAPAPDLLFVVDTAWNLSRVDLATGDAVWRARLLDDRLSGATGLASGTLSATGKYVAALLPTAERLPPGAATPETPPTGVLTVCDAATGDRLWSKTLPQPFPAQAVLAGETCVVNWLDRERNKPLITAYDLASGQQLWQQARALASWAVPGPLAVVGIDPQRAVGPGLWILDPRTGQQRAYVASETISGCGLFARGTKLYGFRPVVPDVSALAGTYAFGLPTG